MANPVSFSGVSDSQGSDFTPLTLTDLPTVPVHSSLTSVVLTFDIKRTGGASSAEVYITCCGHKLLLYEDFPKNSTKSLSVDLCATGVGSLISYNSNAGTMTYTDGSKSLGIRVYHDWYLLGAAKWTISNVKITANYTAGSHSYTSSITQQPTGKNDGIRTYRCACGHSYTEAIPATGFEIKLDCKSNSETGLSCQATGAGTYTFGSKIPIEAINIPIHHSFNEWAIYAKSGWLSWTDNPHVLDINDDVTNDGTWGVVTIECKINYLPHSYTGTVQSNGNGKNATHSFKCIHGCDTYGNATPHNWNNGVQTVAPTCTSTGIKTFTCTVNGCDGSYTESIPKLEHTYQSTVTSPTETMTGYTTHTCSGCGASFKDTYTCLIITKSTNETYGTVTGGKTYNKDTSATLTAIPATGCEFVKWSDGVKTNPRIITVTESKTYTAEFQLKTYTVTFNNETGSLYTTVQAQHGTTIPIPTPPVKNDTAEFKYTFDGWYTDGGSKLYTSTKITDNITYTAKFSSDVQKYTINWYGYDNSIIHTSQDIPYGTKLTYDGPTPTKPADNYYTYTFAGWNPGLEEPIYGNKNFYAQFTAIDIFYTVKWLNAKDKNGNQEVLEIDNNVKYDTQPDFDESANGHKLIHPNEQEGDPAYNYEFIGWSVNVETPTPQPDYELDKIKGNVSYTAIYDASKQLYAITFIWPNDSQTLALEYGTQLDIIPPEIEGYNFVKWSDGNTDNPRQHVVTQETTFEAIYELKKCTLKLSYRDAEGKITDISRGNYNYGTPLKATAVANDGYEFSYWVLSKDDGSETTSTNNPINFDIKENITLGVVFKRIYYTLNDDNVKTEGWKSTNINIISGSLYNNIHNKYTPNSKISIELIPEDRYRFVKWENNSTTNPRQITMSKDTSIGATFEKIPCPIYINNIRAEETYVNPISKIILFFINGNLPTVSENDKTVDGWNFKISNEIPTDSNYHQIISIYSDTTQIQ